MPDSSPEDVVEQDGELQSDVTPAESSPAEEQGETPEDMLSAVQAALVPEKEETPASGDDGDPESEPEPEGEEGEGEDDLSDEEFSSNLKARTKRRFDKLLGERNEYRTKAEQYDRMVGWIADNDLTDQDVNLLFSIGANLRSGNLKAAYDQMAPVFAQLQGALGMVLPEELQRRVNLGEIDEASARQLATSTATSRLAEQRAQRVEQRATQQQQAQQVQAHRQAVTQAVNVWEQKHRGADPDWNLKQQRVAELIELNVHRNGFPKTTAEAVAMADDALKSVNAELQRTRPPKKAVTPVPDAGSNRTQSPPTSMLEAARAGLSRAQAGG